MWTTAARHRRDRLIIYGLALAGAAIIVGKWLLDTLLMLLPMMVWLAVFLITARWLTRCDACGRSVLWWSVTKAKFGDSIAAALRDTPCPMCGYEARPAANFAPPRFPEGWIERTPQRERSGAEGTSSDRAGD
jgi:hypothetical protein